MLNLFPAFCLSNLPLKQFTLGAVATVSDMTVPQVDYSHSKEVVSDLTPVPSLLQLHSIASGTWPRR